MSYLVMPRVEEAIYSRLSGDATLTALLGATSGVYLSLAPEDAVMPYVVYQAQSDGTIDTARCGLPRQTDCLYTVKLFTREPMDDDSIAAADRMLTLLDGYAVVVDTLRLLFRQEQVLWLPERQSRPFVVGVGAIYRVEAKH